MSTANRGLFVGPPDPPPGRLRSAAVHVAWPFLRLGRQIRRHWLLHRGLSRASHWWRPRLWFRSGLRTLFALLLLGWYGVLIVEAARNKSKWDWVGWFDLNQPVPNPALDVLVSTIVPVATAALLGLYFVISRYWRAWCYYRLRAELRSHELVRTAGDIMGEVVGRDGLCVTLMENLRVAAERRPHVISGGMGSGKTALLVRLTELLAAHGAVPIPLSLREAKEKLDFSVMAKERFLDEIRPRVKSNAEGERIWQFLRREQDRIVVLADGLEEALPEDRGRDNKIRLAVRAAQEDRLPIVIASRPQTMLKGLQAAVTDLEPLSEEAALQYVSRDGDWRVDEHRLDWLIEAANVAEAPLFLQIAKDLNAYGLLDPLFVGEDEVADPRDNDEWLLRSLLLDAWVTALRERTIHPELPLAPAQRARTIEYLSALACVGLVENSATVFFSHLYATREKPSEDDKRFAAVVDLLRKQLSHVDGDLEAHPGHDTAADRRVAMAWGARMGLIEELENDSVRFRHSILQAYLGSRLLGRLIEAAAGDPVGLPTSKTGVYLASVFENPSQEMLTALTLCSRSFHVTCTSPMVSRNCPFALIRDGLLRAAERGGVHSSCQAQAKELDDRTSDRMALEVFAATLDIDSFHGCPRLDAVTEPIEESWDKFCDPDHQKLALAKIDVVKRLGEAARLVAKRGHEREARCCYSALLAIGQREAAYAVRLAIARELGAGKDVAFRMFADQWEEDLEETPTVTVDLVHHVAEPVILLMTVSSRAPRAAPQPDLSESQRRQKKRHDEVSRRLTTAEETAKSRRKPLREARKQELLLQALPMLAEAGAAGDGGSAHAYLERYVDRVREGRLKYDRQAPLAQGLKFAANRRKRSPSSARVRDELTEQAWDMLKHAEHWYVRITLLHALTLWALPDDVTEPQHWSGPGSRPRQHVNQWLTRAHDGGWVPEQEHPLVRAAGELSVRALQTRRPERFLWIDEAGTAAHAGSETAAPNLPRLHNLWISPAAGWSTMDHAAQQLLADVLILLTLSDQGDLPKERSRRADRAEAVPHQLPPCLSRDTSPLDPMRTTVPSAECRPGTTCPDGCSFELCPLPPKESDGLRTEFSEVFCMTQRGLLKRWRPWDWFYLRLHRKADWQRRVPVNRLRSFWRQMENRAWERPPEEAGGSRTR